jgi:hypothetical protein
MSETVFFCYSRADHEFVWLLQRLYEIEDYPSGSISGISPPELIGIALVALSSQQLSGDEGGHLPQLGKTSFALQDRHALRSDEEPRLEHSAVRPPGKPRQIQVKFSGTREPHCRPEWLTRWNS